jgi:hypothetical protein
MAFMARDEASGGPAGSLAADEQSRIGMTIRAATDLSA